MLRIPRSDFQLHLDSLDGVAYLTSHEGVLLGYGRRNWDDFARANRASALTQSDLIIGRPLLDFIAGEQVRAAHQAAAAVVLSARAPSISYTYRCDAPDLRRDMQLQISPVSESGEIWGLLYHSLCLRETSRPPLKLLADPLDWSTPPDRILSMCSYCRSVHNPNDGDLVPWITPERYYESGQDDYVRISHGICPECFETIVQPMLAQFKAELSDPDPH